MSDKSDRPNTDLDSIRARIDLLDQQIQVLINERAGLARDAGMSKTRTGKVSDYYRPERESHVLKSVIERNEGPLRDEEMLRLFREIMSACLAQQEPLKVAYLGPEGTFTQTAVFKHFGHSVRALPLASIDEIFQEVESASADLGVVPVENSTEGTVNHTVDRFIASPLKICGEVELRIQQKLLGKMRALDAVARVVAHPQSLAQCRVWLTEYLPGVEQIPASSNAEGARRARDEQGTACIAGEAAADVYGLNVIIDNIEDRPDNTTRFLVIGRELLAPSGSDKTSLLLSARDTDAPGALYDLLAPLAKHQISMTRIESRPSRLRKWHYVFFVDLLGHAEDEKLRPALAELRDKASLFRILGSYPKGME